MYEPKREYNLAKEKREDKKPVFCINCGALIGKGNIQAGVIELPCNQCGVMNTIEARPRVKKT